MRLQPISAAANAFLVYLLFRAQGICLVAANVIVFLLNEIQKLKQM